MGDEAYSVFVSYSHADEVWLKRLRVHLKALQREDLRIDCWDDRRIKPGKDWRAEIREAIRGSQVAVLMVSADFLASDFIAKDELPPLLESAEAEDTLILPLIVKPCRFGAHERLSRFQAINDPARPLLELSEGEQEKIYVKVASVIADHINRERRLGELEEEMWAVTADRNAALRTILDRSDLSPTEKNSQFFLIFQSSAQREKDIYLEMAELGDGEVKKMFLKRAHHHGAVADHFEDLARKYSDKIDPEKGA